MNSNSDAKTRAIYIFIILTTLFMGISTYAYFLSYKDVEDDIIKNDDRIKVTFNDTSNIALVDAKKGDEFTKTFTIKNLTSNTLYYDIVFDNLINNFKDEKDITYSLKGSLNAAYLGKNNMPKSNSNIVSNVKLNANEEHDYTLNINVVNSDEINKTFSTNILVKVIDTKETYSKDMLGYILLSNYDIIDINNTDIENVDGFYYTNNTIDGKTVYYFRGSNNLKNNVLIDNICFKIVRTTEDGGIRVIYNGEYDNGVCSGENNIIDTSEFNTKSNYNAYVGFVYGTPNSAVYEKEHENINSSKIKSVLDSFYSSKLNSNSSLILNSTYCSNRKTTIFTVNKVLYGMTGYRNDNTGYESMYRIINNIPSYKCDQESDRLKVDILSNPIGLITAEEAVYAGINDSNIVDNYLSSSNSYWTMSPAYFNGVNAYNYIVKNGSLWQNNVSEKHGVRPVITLKNSVKVKRGNGASDNPYVIY